MHYKYNRYRQALARLSTAFDEDIVDPVLGALAGAIRDCHTAIDTAMEDDSGAFDAINDSQSSIAEALLGAAFVVSQRCIESVVSNVISLHSYYTKETQDTLKTTTKTKKDIMATGSNLAKGSKFTEIAVIDALANYFKHHDAWTYSWNKAVGPQKITVEIIETVGAKPYDFDNLSRCAGVLGIRVPDKNLEILSGRLAGWRDNIHDLYKAELKIKGLI